MPPSTPPSASRRNDASSSPRSADSPPLGTHGREDTIAASGAAGDGLRFRRRRTPGSSSFRLESPRELSRTLPIDSATSITPDSSGHRAAGKRKVEDASDLFVDKRRSSQRYGGPSAKPSLVGHSPLTRSVANSSPREGRPSPSQVHDASPSSANVVTPASQAQTSLDSDTAQIVNLALNLGETRRRSGTGKLIPGATLRDRRISGVNQIPFPGFDTSGNSMTRNVSRRSTARGGLPTLRVTEATQEPGKETYDASEATLARVEKAQRHFELFTEYIRLLPHLPPLRAPGKLGIHDYENGREYNPLQCIRNRKVRFREKSAIDTDAGGWEDIERVHNWVDSIVGSEVKVDNNPDQRLELPELKPPQPGQGSTEEVPPSSPKAGRPNTSDNQKPRRPRIDWLTSPAALLADAAWLEADSNKLKIEDRDGNKLFPVATPFKTISLVDIDANAETPLDNENPYEQLDAELQDKPSLPSLMSGAAPSSRGRRKHRLAHSISLSSHSHARTPSKSSWRRAFGRPRSASSSSLDSDGAVRKSRAGRPEHSTVEDGHLGAGAKGFPFPEQGGFPRSKFDPSQISRRNYPHSVASTVSDINCRLSAGDIGTAPSSPARATDFPSIAINLSPPPSRPGSPQKLVVPLAQARKSEARSSETSDIATNHPHLREQGPELEHAITLPAFSHVRRSSHDDRIKTFDFRRIDSLPTKIRRGASIQEARIRGMFKSGGIAGRVGSEVSKVGDFIWKRDAPGHSRQSSTASSVVSDQPGKHNGSSIPSTEAGRKDRHIASLSHGSDKAQAGNGAPFDSHSTDLQTRLSDPLPVHGRKDILDSGRPLSDLLPLHGSSVESTTLDTDHAKPGVHPNAAGDLAGLESGLSKVSKVVFRSASCDRRGGTAASGLDALRQQQPTRPKLSEATRNWSLSSQTITRVAESNHVGKREMAAVRAHLMSSGIKALQIRRRAELALDSTTSKGYNDAITADLRFVLSKEATLAARDLVTVFDNRTSELRQSMTVLSRDAVPIPIRDLDRLENLISSSLTPRMRTTTRDAENLTSELTTTSTLAIKNLHDALDKGVRKRNRRFRRMRRLGFVMLEWFLVGAMWFVWLIVMILRVGRGIARALLSGVRWVLWL